MSKTSKRDLSSGWTLGGARPATAPEALEVKFDDGTTSAPETPGPPVPATTVEASVEAGEDRPPSAMTAVNAVRTIETEELISYSTRYSRDTLDVLRWWAATKHRPVQALVNEALKAHLEKTGAFKAYREAGGKLRRPRRTGKASS